MSRELSQREKCEVGLTFKLKKGQRKRLKSAKHLTCTLNLNMYEKTQFCFRMTLIYGFVRDYMFFNNQKQLHKTFRWKKRI